MAQLMPLPLTSHSLLLQEIQIGFTFLVPAHLDIPGQSPGACKTVVVVDSNDILSAQKYWVEYIFVTKYAIETNGSFGAKHPFPL